MMPVSGGHVSDSNLEDLLNQIRSLISPADDAGRRKLMWSLHELAYSMEDENDTIQRFGHLHLQTAAIKIGFDLKLFQNLSATSDSLSVQEIVHRTGAESNLIGRYLRYLASISAIKEDDKGNFTSCEVTTNLASNLTEAGISHYFDTVGPVYQALPAFLGKIGYSTPTDASHTVFQDAWRTPQHVFSWMGTQPERLEHFNRYMALRRAGTHRSSWLDVYPISEVGENWDSNRPLYVNIGGGVGHQCAEFRARFPNLPGRVILQDMPHTIAKALQTPGVENMPHDLFEPQPIRGTVPACSSTSKLEVILEYLVTIASNPNIEFYLTRQTALMQISDAKFYHLRGVLHNHPDQKALRLLQHVKQAMGPQSVVLLEEWIVPETAVDEYLASTDLTMMAAMAGMERTEAQWQTLLSEAGLQIFRKYRYGAFSYETVMEARLL